MEGAEVLALLAAGAAVVVAVIAILVTVRQGQALSSVPGGSRTAELERRLQQVSHRLELVEADVDARGEGSPTPSSSTIRTAGVALSHIGLVRFDAFEDAGGAQSFALALIDDDGDGIVLTSLHSRQTTRLYVKGIRRGVSDVPLSAEEVRAMHSAGIVPTV